MKLSYLLFAVLCGTTFHSKANTDETPDYVVLLNHDTVTATIEKVKLARLTCTVNGTSRHYHPKEILGFKWGGTLYDSGKVRDKAIIFWVRWMFLKKELIGELNLYTITITETSISSNNYGVKMLNEDGSSVRFSMTLSFVRRKDDEQGMFVQLRGFWRYNLEKLVFDCPALIQEMDKGYWGPDFAWFINYYNNGCKEYVPANTENP